MNIRYDEAILQACQAADLRIARCSHRDEPADATGRGGSTPTWNVAEVLQSMGTVPDIIYDLGKVGQEAMIRVLGRDALEVARKSLMIRQCLSND
jgi:hydroxymethylpyrimidine/phosphomethylpyrimidine kinase